MLNLLPWPPNLSLDEIDFTICPLWVQIHHLPPNRRNKENAIKIGNFTGHTLQLEEPFELHIHKKFIRIKVALDTSKSLRPSCHISREDGSPLWIGFKYEQFSDFCYCCGKIDHTESAYPERTQSPATNTRPLFHYGPWLRAGYKDTSKTHKPPTPSSIPPQQPTGRDSSVAGLLLSSLGTTSSSLPKPLPFLEPSPCQSPTSTRTDLSDVSNQLALHLPCQLKIQTSPTPPKFKPHSPPPSPIGRRPSAPTPNPIPSHIQTILKPTPAILGLAPQLTNDPIPLPPIHSPPLTSPHHPSTKRPHCSSDLAYKRHKIQDNGGSHICTG